jgi:4-amino-4-deoxy-L-arabinose transferase-like glycosyltransferase
MAAALAGGAFATLMTTADDVGFARDEGFYYRASLGYQEWFDLLFEDPSAALTRESVDRYWSANHEHPVLMKTLFGFSWRVFHRDLGWLRPSTALRLPGMVMAALCVFLVVLWGTRLHGPVAGLAAGVLLAAQPRFFFHSHLACFDVPVTAMWLATVYAYWKAQHSKRWAVACGLIWGLCLCTKLNAFFIPPMLVVHHVAMLWWERRNGDRSRPVVPLSLVWMAVLGPLVFFAHWPWIWFDPVQRIGFYLGFHRAHPYYNIEYFGTTYFRSPGPVSFPFVMTALTLPATTLLLALLGMGARFRGWLGSGSGSGSGSGTGSGDTLLLVLCVLWPLAIIAWPTVPKFGGTKHWLPAMPVVAMFAGLGLRIVVRGLVDGFAARAGRPILRAVLAGSLALLLIAPAVRETVASHPFALTHYNVLIGGVPGAADAGLNRQYWGYTTGSLVEWLDANVEPGGSVFFHDTAYDAVRMYIDDSSLRRDIRWGSTDDADIAIVHHEQHMAHVEYEIWERFDTTVPIRVLSHEGVPVISIYGRNIRADRARP